MINLFDTNLLYALVNPNDLDSAKLLRLQNAGVIHISDVSIVEWIVRNARPDSGDLERLKQGLALLDGHKLKRLSSPYIELNDSEINAFKMPSSSLMATEPLRQTLLKRRIKIEHDFLNWALVIALAAYLSHIAHSLFPRSSPLDTQVEQTIETILKANLTFISDSLRSGIEKGYATNDPDRCVNSAINELRKEFFTAARIRLTELAGNSLSQSEIQKTLDTDTFRKFISREAKSGNFNKFIAAVKNDILLKPDSQHCYTVNYIFARLDKPLNLGANHKRNDINDAFIVGHLFNPEVAILTRDQAMIDTLLQAPFRPAIAIDESLESLEEKM